jgi:hypothetical protein
MPMTTESERIAQVIEKSARIWLVRSRTEAAMIIDDQ